MNLSFAILIFLILILSFEIIKAVQYDNNIKKLKKINRNKRLTERTSFLVSNYKVLSPEEKFQIREIVYEIIDEENKVSHVSILLNAIRDGMIMGLLSGLIIGGDNKSAIKGAIIWSIISGFLANIKFYI